MIQDPIRFHPGLESPDDSEPQVTADLIAALQQILETTSEDYGHAVRAVHAKSHGLIEAELTVLDGLAPEYAQGLFATAGTHPAVIRLSTNPGDLLADSISVPRGLALKLLKVEGERLPGAEGDTQDFVMVNGPVFVAPDAETFLGSLKLLAKTTDRAEWAKKALSAVLRGAERVIEAVGSESGTLKTMGGAPNVHPLGERYFTQTAYRYGDHVAKLSLVPVSARLTRHGGERIEVDGRHDAIREDVDRAMREGPAEWELRVQLCRDPEAMPIEDPTVLWDEAESPFVTVARLRAEAQPGWSQDRAERIDEAMRFSPWTGLEAHRPLGSVNRVRKATYEASADFRSRFNRCPMHEPSQLAG